MQAALPHTCQPAPYEPCCRSVGWPSTPTGQAATGVEPSPPYLIVMGDDGRDLAASEHHILPRKIVDHPGTGVQGMVEGVLAAVAPVPALKSAGSLHGQDLLVNRLPLATQAHRELVRRGPHGGDEMSPRADASTTQAAAVPLAPLADPTAPTWLAMTVS